ncbi:RNA 2'-phosphotransferase [Halogeometricum limi]|uniref:Probable RNA 2'-phosphotransferase n=1 Tax=Halogeometricum limi TaxID=555875 RepID=A0A1I6IFR3_9EURY|nr:RNA 2'-phosphotransferase [Halogeometricum limi]SFR65536.1 putative RNA 2'-phosphotransferase [Halogeometricum limi]
MIRVCEDHGYVDGEACPECGNDGRPLLRDDRRTRLSKFLSGALRHYPDDVGLSVDGGGWADYDAVVEAGTEKYSWADADHIDAVVATDPKGRFERRGDRIRAAYGHSIDVELEPTDEPVPDRLYHGTAPRALDAIRDEGLRPMSRQSVHLSETREEARAVGRRHADDPVLLAVDARSMERDGISVDRRGGGTFTAERVPPKYIERVNDK